MAQSFNASLCFAKNSPRSWEIEFHCTMPLQFLAFGGLASIRLGSLRLIEKLLYLQR